MDEGLVADLDRSGESVYRLSEYGWGGGWRLTVGTFMTSKETVLAREMIAEQMMRAVVGRMSNSAGHKEMGKSVPRLVLLYTESVSAAVPRVVRPARRARSVAPKRTDSTR